MPKYIFTERVRSAGRDANRGDVVELGKIEGRHRRKRGQVRRYNPDGSDDEAETDSDLPDGWKQRATEALESDNGNKMRTVLGEINEAEKTKPKNRDKIEEILSAED